jgi:hypothetical protein
MKVLFIGILTEEVLKNTQSEGLVGTLIDIQDAVTEVGKICDAYRTENIDPHAAHTPSIAKFRRGLVSILQDRRLASRQ